MVRVACAILLFLAICKNGRADGLCDFFEGLSDNLVNISEPCLKQMHTVCNNPLLGWQFFDATSKMLTSGMSYSNVIDYGNFPECLSINNQDENGTIIGKFCGLSHLVSDVLLTPQTINILENLGINTNLTEVKGPQQISIDTFSKLRDVLMPDVQFVLSKYSSCVPDACTPKEVGHFYGYAGILLPPDMLPLISYTDLTCETVNSNTDYDAGDIVVITFFSIIALLMVASTIYDALCRNFRTKPHHELLIAFSILFNGRKLLEISTNTTEQIQIFNGMRFISMMWVVAYHGISIYYAGFLSAENFPEAKAWSESITNRYIQSGLLAVDTFFFISGFLLAFTYIKKNEDSPVEQLKKVPKMYLHRYLRLTPPALAMFLVTITIFRHMGSGPTWTLITNFFGQPCRDNWWKFFLYIQNYTNPDEMCINPMWYLSADMQMFILAPLVLIPMATYIKKKFRAVIYTLIGLTVLAVLIPMLTRYFTSYDGVGAGNIYMTHDRFTNFLIGITFGAIMRMYKHKPFIFSPVINLCLWIVVLLVSIFFNLYWFDVEYNYDLVKYTVFNGLYRPVWCLSLCFMVYSCYHNQGGFPQWILSRPTFQILGKLSYCMYVMHALVQVYAAATATTAFYFSNYSMFYNWCGHIIVTMVLSVIWVLAFEFPMLTIDKYILGDGRKPAPKKVAEKQ